MNAVHSWASDVLVARQPILDRDAVVVAYELLARRTLTDGAWAGGDESQTTARIIAQAFLDMDVWSITEGLPAFVNFPRALLFDGTVEALPSLLTVVEILETVAPDAAVAQACRRLRAAGYRIALDDVIADDPRLALLDVVDVVKVDFSATSPDERGRLLARCREAGAQVLAEKVETRAQHDEALRLGCDLFQGYFFQEPTVMGGHRPHHARLLHVQLLRSAIAAEVDRDVIGNLLARDPGAVARLGRLRGCVGPQQGEGERERAGGRGSQGEPPRTQRVALEDLDAAALVRLVSLLVVVSLGVRHPRPLLDTTLIRARFCERLAEHVGDGTAALDAHLVGLCSLLDALVGEPLANVLARVGSPAWLTAACVHGAGRMGRVLRLVCAYEHGDWTAVRQGSSALDLDGGMLGPLYLDCLAWARDLQRAVGAARPTRAW
jgi:EAL and modified HD-GYP domain-containing signal transduction protein